MAKQYIYSFILLIIFNVLAYGQTLPEQEFQANLSGYFDNFNVNVVYPSISLTRNIGDYTSITGRYLVDMITAASIKKNTGTSSTSVSGDNSIGTISLLKQNKYNTIDAVTAASGRSGGGTYNETPMFDEVRNEFNLGVTQILGSGLLSLNGIHSSESDYTSNTIAGTYQQFFAKNNASFQLGLVRSWDKIYPATKDWTKNKNVLTLSANFSQVLSQSLILQLLGSYSKNSGLLADVYQQVTLDDGTITDPVEPELRITKASALKLKYRLSSSSSLETSYRYYWDSWDIKSHTISINYMKYISKYAIMNLGIRTYSQNRASFFQPSYTSAENYKTVDIKLDSGHSTEYQIGFILLGSDSNRGNPFLSDDRIQYDFNINFYSRHSTTPYWFNNKQNLFATNFNIGLRYRLK